MTTNPHLDVWEINAAEFPAEGSAGERLKFLLRYAILAPSTHNTQPWLFSISNDRLDLYADRSRGLRVTDPNDRQLIISCGCALLNLRVAMLHHGFAGDVRILPDPLDPDLLASVRLGQPAFPPDANERLFDAIPKRRTNRQLFRDDPLPPDLLSALQQAASREKAWLHLVESDQERATVADLIAEGDRHQWAMKRFRLELAAWTHPNTSPAGDGIPNYAMNTGDLLSVAGPMIIRTFDLGDGQAAKDRDIARFSPGLVILGTTEENEAAWLAAGQALQRVLLLARAHHVYASYLNQPIEVPALAPKLCAAIGRRDYPQIILRMGFGPHVNPTPRRTVAELMG